MEFQIESQDTGYVARLRDKEDVRVGYGLQAHDAIADFLSRHLNPVNLWGRPRGKIEKLETVLKGFAEEAERLGL